MHRLLFLLCVFASLQAETNTTASNTFEDNITVKQQTSVVGKTSHAEKILQRQVEEQMKREKKYAKEQKFYQGKDYNLTEHKVDPETLKNIPVIEPDYDFDITDVYRDDI